MLFQQVIFYFKIIRKKVDFREDSITFLEHNRFPLCYRSGQIGRDWERIYIQRILQNYLKWIEIYDCNRDMNEIERLINLEINKYEKDKNPKLGHGRREYDEEFLSESDASEFGK